MGKACSVCGQMIAPVRLARSPRGEDLRAPGLPGGAPPPAGTCGRQGPPAQPTTVERRPLKVPHPPLNTRRTRRLTSLIYIICPHAIATHTHLH